jgi:MFS family permease
MPPADNPPASAAVPVPPMLWTRDFTLFIVGLAAATLAVQIQAAVVGYQLYTLTRDPLSLGTIGLTEALPFIALALVSGHVADVVDRRKIVLGAFAFMALAAAVLLTLTRLQQRLPAGTLKLGIYLVIGCGGVCRSFLLPARLALSAQLVPRALYPKAIAWRTGVFQLCAVTGPAVGGLIYGVTGAGGAYVASLSLFLAATTTMLALRPPPRAARTAPTSILSSVRAGFRFLRSEPVLLPAITLDLFAVLFGGAVALLPVFAEEILHVGPRGFGLLRAAPAAGALVASAILALRPPLRRAGRALLLAVAGFGGCMIAFGLSRWFALSLALLVVSGALDMVSILVRTTLLQTRVPDQMLGRVASINQIFIGSSNEIGAFESGLAARLLGTVPSVVFGGTVTLGVVAALAWRSPPLRRLGSLVS